MSRLEVYPLQAATVNPRQLARVRFLLVIFVGWLVVSGITAFPLRWEIDVLKRIFVDDPSSMAHAIPGLVDWLTFVHRGIVETYTDYPFIAYGTDWLAYAHIVIAIAFLGPIRNPVRNVWVVEWGMIACALVIPTALVFGSLRGIPFGWQLIDMSFGVIGIVPLWLARREVRQMVREV